MRSNFAEGQRIFRHGLSPWRFSRLASSDFVIIGSTDRLRPAQAKPPQHVDALIFGARLLGARKPRRDGNMAARAPSQRGTVSQWQVIARADEQITGGDNSSIAQIVAALGACGARTLQRRESQEQGSGR